MNAAILLAAGKGKRMLETVSDKALAKVNGRSLFARSLAAFREADLFDLLVVTYRDEEQRARLEAEVEANAPPFPTVTFRQGGEERRHSVWTALEAIPEEVEIVFAHDCARPMVRADSLRLLLREAEKTGGAALARPVRDTLKRARAADVSRAVTTGPVDRANLWGMETPQAFRTKLLREGMKKAFDEDVLVTDESSAIELAGRSVTLIDPGYPNPKVTTPADLSYVEFLLRENEK